MQPSSAADFTNPEIAALIELAQHSPAASPADNVKFNRLAWDAAATLINSMLKSYDLGGSTAP